MDSSWCLLRGRRSHWSNHVKYWCAVLFVSISLYCYLFYLSLYLSSLTLEAHCYNNTYAHAPMYLVKIFISSLKVNSIIFPLHIHQKSTILLYCVTIIHLPKFWHVYIPRRKRVWHLSPPYTHAFEDAPTPIYIMYINIDRSNINVVS